MFHSLPMQVGLTAFQAEIGFVLHNSPAGLAWPGVQIGFVSKSPPSSVCRVTLVWEVS